MKTLLLGILLMAGHLPAGLAQKAPRSARTRAVAVAFFDEERLRHNAGQDALKDFEYFFFQIQDIVKRDFPNVELRILRKGELLHLPDGTALNVQNMRPEIGYVLSAAGKKKRILTGVQSEADFACAAATFFQRRSTACPK